MVACSPVYPFNHQCSHFCFSLSGVVRTVTPFSHPLLLGIAKEVLVKKGQKDDESIHSFISRRLGKEVISTCCLQLFHQCCVHSTRKNFLGQHCACLWVHSDAAISICVILRSHPPVFAAGRHSCGQLLSRYFRRGLQEVEHALLLSCHL